MIFFTRTLNMFSKTVNELNIMNLNSNTRTIHICKAGTFTDINGRLIGFSESDLDIAAAAYNAQHKKGYNAPLCIGHPLNDYPQYGRANALISRNGNLYATVTPDNNLLSLVRDGRYKKVSVSFHQPDSLQNPAKGAYLLKHIGFLGGMPPAIKGLESFQFSESFDLPYFFAESSGTNSFAEYVNLSEDDPKNIMHNVIQDIARFLGVSYLEAARLYNEFIGD